MHSMMLAEGLHGIKGKVTNLYRKFLLLSFQARTEPSTSWTGAKYHAALIPQGLTCSGPDFDSQVEKRRCRSISDGRCQYKYG
jgi:hypothetical protein